jgi:hypothetical protein
MRNRGDLFFDPAAKGILTLLADQADFEETFQGIAEGAAMRAQGSAARIANAEFLDQGGIAQSALRRVVNAFGMAVQFELIKTGGVFEKLRYGCEFLQQVGDTLAEGEMLRKLLAARRLAERETGSARTSARNHTRLAGCGSAIAPRPPRQVAERWRIASTPVIM